MNHKDHKTERIHSLDSLRAIMMLLGLILHSALTYNVTDHGNTWLLKDPNTTHIFTDFLVFIIHSFRIPIFFFVSGFFGAMLFYERGILKMIKNRVLRILFPFIVFLMLLWPIIIFVFSYTSAVFSNLGDALQIALNPLLDFKTYIPKATSHLWFLYYLSIITGTTVLLGIMLKKVQKLTRIITENFNWIIQRPLTRVLFFSFLTFLILMSLKTSMVAASVSLAPDISTFVYFFFFYLIGWLLYKSKQYLRTFVNYDWFFTIAAVILVTIQGLTIKKFEIQINSDSVILIIYSSLSVCLFLFGITGLFIRYCSKHSNRMRYFSDSSYWVYLIHLPLTALIPSFIWKLSLPAIGKYLIVLFVTSIISFLSYHYLVRNTFIGKFLNGRKYPRK